MWPAVKVLTPSSFQGNLALPPSKSHTMRALLLSALSQGVCNIDNPLQSPDVEAMVKAIQLLGAQVSQSNSHIAVKGIGMVPERLKGCALDVGNSGQVLRFMSACFAQAKTPVFITGDQSIKTQRPLKPLLQALTQLGAYACSLNRNGTAPVILQGAIRGGYCRLDGEDSQPVSALLMTVPLLEQDSVIEVDNLGERPWVDFTLSWLDFCGLSYRRQNDSFWVPGGQRITPFNRNISGDLSALAFPLILGLLTPSNVTIEGVDLDDPQNDKRIIQVLEGMGASFTYKAHLKQLIVQGPQKLHGCSIDVNPFIDAVPALAVVGCFASGVTTLFNGEIARKKESDRMLAMQRELGKMGARVDVQGGKMTIYQSALKGAELSSWSDHRVAMALACAAYAAHGTSTIIGVDCIAKSFPHFFSAVERICLQ